MTDFLQPFVSDSLPSFITAENPQFQAFIEAYYEWLELQNDSESNSVLTAFKQLRNPGGIINNITTQRDIDNTVDSFVEYFKNEVLPVAIDFKHITGKFAVKKIRDLYLAKGTPKSFSLLFRMLYNEEIQIFETRDNIIRASAGRFLSFPIAAVEVIGNANQLNNLNFTLANIYRGNTIIGHTLSGTVAGSLNGNNIVNLQLNSSELDFGDSEVQLTIVDPTDSRIFINVKGAKSLDTLTIIDGGSGYNVGDSIKVRNKSTGRVFVANVSDIKAGNVTHLSIRDRGEFYRKGDTITFTGQSSVDGSGGQAEITAVDTNGRILEINRNQVRTGELLNGFLADTFEDVRIPLDNGGSWKRIPNINTVYTELTPEEEGLILAPTPLRGQNAKITPISDNIGQINNIDIFERGFFDSDGDVQVIAPMVLTFEEPVSFANGESIAFQTFKPLGNSFEHDSEVIVLRIGFSDSEYTTGKKFRIPYSFDSELFQWRDSEYDYNELKTPGRLKSWLAKTTFQNTITNVDKKTFLVKFRNKFIDRLDYYHFNQLDRYNKNDSDFSLSWYIEPETARPAVRNNIGQWVSTKYYASVNGTTSNSRNVVINELQQGANSFYPFPTDSDLDSINNQPDTILRVASLDPITNDITLVDSIQKAHIVAHHKRPRLTYNLSYTGTTSRTFLNEDSFLNSLSGGVIRDNLVYSNHTYIIQSSNSISSWREVIKKTLHPAGSVLFGEIAISAVATNSKNITAETNVGLYGFGLATFDASQEHYESSTNTINAITADSTNIETNAHGVLNHLTAHTTSVTASNYTTGSHLPITSQHGNSFWDFEPLGEIRESQLDSDGLGNAYKINQNYLNFDSDKSDVYTAIHSTQTKTGNKINTGNQYFDYFNNTKQELYKNNSRINEQVPLIVRTTFNLSDNQTYNTIDSDIPASITWATEKDIFKQFNYANIKRDKRTITFRFNYTSTAQQVTPTFKLPWGFDYANNQWLDSEYSTQSQIVSNTTKLSDWTAKTKFSYIITPVVNNSFSLIIEHNDGDYSTNQYSKLSQYNVIGRKPGFTTTELEIGYSVSLPVIYPAVNINRSYEIKIKNEADFNRAMRMNDSLTFTDATGTYTNFEAYERKWNRVNTLMTLIDSDLWSINGLPATIQNTKQEYPRIYKKNIRHKNGFNIEGYPIKTPLSLTGWQGTLIDSDLVWRRSYAPEINSIGENIIQMGYDSDTNSIDSEVVIYSKYDIYKPSKANSDEQVYIPEEKEYKTFKDSIKDPQISMRGRRDR